MALTVADVMLTIFGDKRFGCKKVTGDGATKTYAVGIDHIEAAWFQEGTDTESSTNNLITWSGSTVTWATAIDSSTYGHLFYIGQ